MPEASLNATIETALSWRYATKRFDPTRKISAADWNTLERSLLLAPSSFGLQPWHFVVITNPELRKNLQPHSWNQPQIVEASHLVVLAAKRSMDVSFVDAFIEQTATTRAIPVAELSGYRQMIVAFIEELAKRGELESWATRQAYLALGMLLSSAALLGIDACPLEGIDSSKYDEILELPSRGFSTQVACALGYRSASDSFARLEKIRYPKEQVFSFRA